MPGGLHHRLSGIVKITRSERRVAISYGYDCASVPSVVRRSKQQPCYIARHAHRKATGNLHFNRSANPIFRNSLLQNYRQHNRAPDSPRLTDRRSSRLGRHRRPRRKPPHRMGCCSTPSMIGPSTKASSPSMTTTASWSTMTRCGTPTSTTDGSMTPMDMRSHCRQSANTSRRVLSGITTSTSSSPTPHNNTGEDPLPGPLLAAPEYRPNSFPIIFPNQQDTTSGCPATPTIRFGPSRHAEAATPAARQQAAVKSIESEAGNSQSPPESL